QKQRNTKPDQESTGEEQLHQLAQRIWLDIGSGATHQDLQARIDDRLREVEPVLALGRDRDGCDPEIRPSASHGVKQFTDIGHDNVLSLAIQSLADAVPKFNAKAA